MGDLRRSDAGSGRHRDDGRVPPKVVLFSFQASRHKCSVKDSIKHAISYCALCGAERSSADKVMRTPISKQRNKRIQHVLVEAAKLAPRQCHELALVYEKEMQRGNRNRATLAVARKIVAYLLAVERRQQDFVPTEKLRSR